MKNNLEHKINWVLLTNYLSNEANEEEISKVEQWIKEDKTNLKYLEKISKIWNNTADLERYESVDVENSLQKVKRKANIGRKTTKKIELNIHKQLLRIAAVLIISAGVLWSIQYIRNSTSVKKYIAKTNEITKSDLLLSDGSIVYLNANTILEYPKEFKKDKREVFLKGQAFFDIKKDKTSPFIIHAGNARIEVLGTSFDVNAYSNNTDVEVIVKTGKVAFSNNPKEKKADYERVILIAGDKGIYSNSNNKIEKKKNEDTNYLSWKTREIIFENSKLINVLKTLEKAYKISIRIEEEKLNNLELTATFHNKSIDEILEIIEVTLNIKINKQEKFYIVKNKK